MSDQDLQEYAGEIERSEAMYGAGYQAGFAAAYAAGVAAEREACAVLCEERAHNWRAQQPKAIGPTILLTDHLAMEAEMLADDIRARKPLTGGAGESGT